jgi:hypothetical protein
MSRRHASIGFARRSGRDGATMQLADPSTIIPPALRGAWWRADRGVAITSGTVSGWTDIWAGNVLGNGTTSRQPVFESAGLGGRPTVLFDGVDDSLTCELSTACAAGTRPYTWTVFQFVSVTGIIVTIAALTDVGQGVVSRLLQQSTGTVLRTFRQESGGVSSSANGPAQDTSPHRIESGFTAGGLATLVVDSSTSNTAITGVPAADIGHVRIGAAGAGADQFANVRIAEHIIMRDEPSATVKAALAAYASSRYAGVTDAIPGPNELFAAAGRVAWYETDIQWVTLNGGNVSSLINLWGNGDAVQGTAANQALYEPTGWNGLPSMQGDGIDDTYVATLVSQPPAGSRLYLWCVHQYVTAPTAVAMAMCVYPSGGSPATHMQVRCDNTNWFLNLNNTTENTGPAKDTSRHLLEEGHLSFTTGKFAMDGVSVSGVNTNATLTAATDRIRLFGNQSGASLPNARLKSVVLVSVEPSTAQVTAMRAWYHSRNLGITGI